MLMQDAFTVLGVTTPEFKLPINTHSGTATQLEASGGKSTNSRALRSGFRATPRRPKIYQNRPKGRGNRSRPAPELKATWKPVAVADVEFGASLGGPTYPCGASETKNTW